MELINGNTAVVKGAIKAGCEFFGGYPITPASEILEGLAKENIKVMQMEDEIASINATIGASLSGNKSMTATSGPGFSLMQETIGYAHMTQIPLVIVDVQRGGPGTGMPTKPSQGDIMQSRYGSSGDYNPIVFYPNSIEELYIYTIKSFNCAEQAEMPVVLLSDSFLANLYETVDLKNEIGIKKRKTKPFGNGGRHLTSLAYKDNESVPEDAKNYQKLINQLFKKSNKIAKSYNDFEYIVAKGFS